MSDDSMRHSSASLSAGEIAIERGGSPYGGARVVRLDDFEAASSMEPSQLDAYKRRFGLLFADESTRRRGGLGVVVRVTNVFGEQFALKTLAIPERDELVGEAEHERLVKGLRQSFRQEFECHKAVSGLKGFPRLYGMGNLDGVPAIVMEWVRGESLAQVCDELAVEASGRMAPLVAAQIGRDIFELLSRMDFIEGGFVHRDISLGNVMVKTLRRSIREQVEDGSFDVCLVDFGSSTPAAVRGSSFTSTASFTRRATVDFAPPEMLTDDIENLEALRMSPKIDVYATAGVVYRLACGRPPDDFSAKENVEGAPSSPYRVKVGAPPARGCFAHIAAADVFQVLACEPAVGQALRRAAATLDGPLDAEEARDALSFVDEQLNELLLPCLAAQQAARPAAAEMQSALAAFCGHYLDNVACSLKGEPLIPCMLNGMPEGFAREALSARSVARTVAKTVAAVVWLVVVVATGALADGLEASFSWGGLLWRGALAGPAVSAALAAPAIAGIACRAGSRATRAGFMRGTLGLAVAAAAVAAIATHIATNPSAAQQSLVAALFAAAVAGWCPLVADFALAPAVAVRRARTRQSLPTASNAGGANGVGPGDARALEEAQGRNEASCDGAPREDGNDGKESDYGK